MISDPQEEIEWGSRAVCGVTVCAGGFISRCCCDRHVGLGINLRPIAECADVFRISALGEEIWSFPKMSKHSSVVWYIACLTSGDKRSRLEEGC
jgi:hypothetical protein